MNCEMCGAEFAHLKRARVEGTIMNVCNNCTKFGEILDPPRAAATTGPATIESRLQDRQRRREARNVLDEMDGALVEGFGEKIRLARERKGWTREQLADHIHQPVPTVTKYEAEHLHPSDKAIQLLQRELGIKLIEPAPRTQIPTSGTTPARGLTLGDLIKDAQKKAK